MSAPAGLQSERTVLAWRRTALAATVVSVLLVRAALSSDSRPARLVLALSIATLAAVLVAARGRHRRHRALVTDPTPLPTAQAAAICAGIAATACGALLPLV
ncbi:DUF202 domain-containing protein [Nocardia salmonicida]|uniref:DUF202 domain-containing protein n=1 Tax=Nocardia salmonicida TaxID=53431 RepID=UPI0036BF5FE2